MLDLSEWKIAIMMSHFPVSGSIGVGANWMYCYRYGVGSLYIMDVMGRYSSPRCEGLLHRLGLSLSGSPRDLGAVGFGRRRKGHTYLLQASSCENTIAGT